jgi:hypothetical protein
MLDARMVSVDAVDEYGNTVLIVAAQNNLKKIVKVRVPCSFSAPNPLLRISHQSQAVLRRGAYVTPCPQSRMSSSLSPNQRNSFSQLHRPSKPHGSNVSALRLQSWLHSTRRVSCIERRQSNAEEYVSRLLSFVLISSHVIVILCCCCCCCSALAIVAFRFFCLAVAPQSPSCSHCHQHYHNHFHHPPLPLTYVCRYGLTCRQGLAPGNLLTSRSVSAAANSATAAGSDGKGSALGYVTERRNISQQQQQQQQQQQRATVAREQSVGIEQHFNAGEPRVNPPSPHTRRTPVRTSLSLLIQYLFS